MPEQTTLDEAMASVEGNNFDWLVWARGAALAISLTAGSVTTDDIHDKADAQGLQPDSPHAWGAIFKCKGWTWVGRERSRYASNHGRHISRWRWNG